MIYYIQVNMGWLSDGTLQPNLLFTVIDSVVIICYVIFFFRNTKYKDMVPVI